MAEIVIGKRGRISGVSVIIWGWIARSFGSQTARLAPMHGKESLVAGRVISTMQTMRTAIVFAVVMLAGFGWREASANEELAARILGGTKTTGGFIVHLGCGEGSLTEALRANEGIVVHGLDRDAAKVKAARGKISDYGPISVEQLVGDRLPYLDGIVNLVVVEDDQGITREEVLRVLRPLGSAYVKDGESWNRIEKPWPSQIDDWTHYFHSAGGNTVAHDSEVGPPRHLKWVGSPRWSRHHDRMASMSALVSNEGRLFYIMDEGSRISIQMPPKWELVGRDAFNGVILWKLPIPDWHSHLWPLKSGPTQLARRLVAEGDSVYCTLGYRAPVSQIDAATGEIRRAFEGSDGTEELIVSGDTLFVMSMKEPTELQAYRPETARVGDQGKVATRYQWDELERVLVAYDVNSGEQLWSHVSRVAPLTITADEERFYYHDGETVVARNGRSGEEVWRGAETDRREKMTINFGPRLVAEGGQVYYAGGDRLMHVYEAATGKELWNAPHARGGYQSPEDLIVMQDLVWSAPLYSGKDSGLFTGRDLKTGEVIKEFAPDVETYWFHHRCYIAKATDRFLMPSRTGIEFVDPQAESWDINHWVRGGCLYGVMPANGLTYAPPHNCACYPETKLYGFNALSAAGPRHSEVEQRLETGPAFGRIAGAAAGAEDWPTFRHDSARSGYSAQSIAASPSRAWETEIGGRLSAVTAAAGKIFVAQVDRHTVHALDEESGKVSWSFTAGGRVDSPPTYAGGSVLFGSADGCVYCLDAKNGTLAWKFRAAPGVERHMAFEQLESVWPVHGSILVEDGCAYFVCGRSNFLDGGLRFYKLEVGSGKVLSEKVIDEINPETGNNLQEKIATLQMPAGLPDILAYQNGYVYMRSQQFDLDGNRIEIGPHSSDAAAQGAVQKGDEHLFAPMSYLDDTYFHRAYWVYGRSFAGGHNGYYQAGKNAPSGRLLVADEDNVYGFGRKPEYLRWTTTLEHQLFSASREAPEGALSSVEEKDTRRSARKKPDGSMISFEATKTIEPSKKALGIEAWVKMEGKEGVVAAHGGPRDGYALVVRQGRPRFLYRSRDTLASAVAKQAIGEDWVHLVGQIRDDKSLELFVNGKKVASGMAKQFISQTPVQSLQIAADDQSAVGDYKSPLAIKATLDEVVVFHGTLSAEEVADRCAKGPAAAAAGITPVVVCNFDDANGNDRSGFGNHGVLSGGTAAEGKFGGGMYFRGKMAQNQQAGATLVEHHWTGDIPLFARAMVLAGDTLFVAGPPDIYDEEETFQKLAEGDPEVEKLLAKQDAALNGAQGAVLWAVSAKDGSKRGEVKLEAIPNWDGMAAASGKLIISTRDGKVVALK